MSRIGKLPINIPAGVTVTTKDNVVTVKGPKGELTQKIDPSIIVKVEDNEMTFSIDVMEFSLGYTHPIFLQLPPEIKVETKSERNKNPYICLESCDKQLLGQVCAKIRSFRMPEPYKGKGILYIGEQIRRKSGKAAGAK